MKRHYRGQSDPCKPRHNWMGTCQRCGKEHHDMREVFALNDVLREECRQERELKRRERRFA